MKSKIIYGCEARGDADKPYLTRWTLFHTDKLKVFFHKFHRSDADDLHDHPWNFISIILWRGYNEVTFTDSKFETRKKKRVWPGMVIFRRANHTHRVELIDGKPAYTLVFVFKQVRQWGFWFEGKWMYWRTYFVKQGCE